MKIRLAQSHQTLSMFSYSSLTDIVLLLLIFFLLTSSFIVSEGLKVSLPEAVNTDVSEQKHITIALTEEGHIYINNEIVPADHVSETLASIVEDPENQVLVLRSDKTVPIDRVVFVMDAAKGVGATRFFISTNEPEKRDDAHK